MPELPEVETTLRGIAPDLVGVAVTGLAVRQPQLRWPVPDLSPLIGQPLLAMSRRGKYLLWQFTSGTLLVHLGMSGSLRLVKQNEPPMVHDHVDVDFANGWRVRYADPRRFGAWVWAGEAPLTHALLKDLGPEPLSEAFSGEYLYQASRGRKVAIKSFIMDSHQVVGVGNIYANEALFLAGVYPNRAAGRVSRARCDKLAESIKTVLGDAIRQGGTTLRDFVGGDGKPGYFKQQLRVYGRAGQACVKCAAPLKEIRMGQRTTVFCKVCQT